MMNDAERLEAILQNQRTQLRDMFAAAALQGLLAGKAEVDDTVQAAYWYADQMLAARDRAPDGESAG